MFIIDKIAEHRLDIVLGGSIDAEEMERGLDELIAQSEDITNGRMLYTLTDFEIPGLAAFAVEMSRLPKLLGLLGKFERCAVLCDTHWIRVAAEVEGAVLPGLEIKAFEIDQKAEAEAWLATGPA